MKEKLNKIFQKQKELFVLDGLRDDKLKNMIEVQKKHLQENKYTIFQEIENSENFDLQYFAQRWKMKGIRQLSDGESERLRNIVKNFRASGKMKRRNFTDEELEAAAKHMANKKNS